MSGNTFGRYLTLTTFGESHGKALGAVLDGIPAGMALSEEDIRPYLERRRPGGMRISTKRNEPDAVEILSGVYEGRTTGTPIAMLVRNQDAHSKDYDALAEVFRPGHADYTYEKKYGLRDVRGGGRSSGRETLARVMGGAVCAKLLTEAGVSVTAYTESIGSVRISDTGIDEAYALHSATAMPDPAADREAQALIDRLVKEGDSAGGVIRCIIRGVPAGTGDPVFDKLDARLAGALMSVGAVKAVEIGDGIRASSQQGSEHNDAFAAEGGRIVKRTNHAGGILGGIADGSDILVRIHVKPTPSVSLPQQTVTKDGSPHTLTIKGRHDPVIVPRAVVVAESMCALVIADSMLLGMSARLSDFVAFYKKD